MAMTGVQAGNLGTAYAKLESGFGVVATLTAAEAFRYNNLTFPGSDVKNKRTIMEKKESPFVAVSERADGRTTSGFNLSALLRPSATINTVPEMDPFLEAAFGSKTNVVLSTTVASGGAVGGATLTSGTGLAVGGAVLITCPDGKKRARFLLTVAGAVVTWAPNLPAGQQPANGAVVKSGLVYKLTTTLTKSLSIAHYLKNPDGSTGLSRIVTGAMVDKLGMNFDANSDPMLSASGPGKFLDTAGAPAKPGGATRVGAQPPSGIVGEFLVGNTAAKMMKLGFDLTNSVKLRNESYGYSSAEDGYRMGRASMGASLDMRAESETLIYDLAEAGTNTPIFLQAGFTEGNIIAVRAPNVEFPVPDTDDPDDELSWGYKGMALETTDGALDALQFALL